MPALAVEMQVAGIEEARAPERREIGNAKFPAAQRDEAGAAQFLKRAVHVHGRQARRVGDFGLRDRQVAGGAVREADRAQAQEELAEQVAEALEGGALAEIDGPFPLDRAGDEALPGEGLGDAGMVGGDLLEISCGISAIVIGVSAPIE